MKQALPTIILQNGLDYWWPKVSALDGIPFFGTLLGLVRNGRPIDGDDDVDFLLPAKSRLQIMKLIDESDFYYAPRDYVPICEEIIQIRKKVQDQELIIDFYFYTESVAGECILGWHFFDSRSDPDNYLRIPSKLLISQPTGVNKHLFPKKSKKILKFLYGSKWKKPALKNTSYQTFIYYGKPKVVFFKVSFFDQIVSKRQKLIESPSSNAFLLYLLILLTISPIQSFNLAGKKLKKALLHLSGRSFR